MEADANATTRHEVIKSIIDVEHGLLDRMIDFDILTDDQMDTIKGESDKIVDRLLELVARIPSEDVGHFFQALDDTQQTHVSNFIRANGCRAANYGDDWPLICNEELMKTLRRNRTTLIDLIDCNLGLLDEMLAAGCINRRQNENVTHERTNSGKNGRLLKIIKRGSVKDFNSFIRCLVKTKQDAAAALLAPYSVGKDVLPLSEEIKTRITLRLPVLIDNLNVVNGLLNDLLASNCITRRQNEFIKAGSTDSDKNRCLLDILMKSSQTDFDKFIECLVKDNQWHVRRLLLDDGAVPEHDADNGKGDDVEEEERRAVDVIMNILKRRPDDRKGIFSDRLIQHIENFRTTLGAELVTVKQTQSITLVWLCHTKHELFRFHQLYVLGKLRIAVEELFLLALDSERTTLRTNSMQWLMPNYLSCTQCFSTLDSLSIQDESLAGKPSSSNSEDAAGESTLFEFQKWVELPPELTELLVKKAAGHLFVRRNKFAPHRKSFILTTLGKVSLLWWRVLSDRRCNKLLLKRYFKNFCEPFDCWPVQVADIDVEGGRPVCGVAELKDKLYVACYGSSTIHVFNNSSPFIELEHFEVEGLNDTYDVVTCHETSKLYIADRYAHCIWQLNILNDRKPSKFITTTFLPYSISLSHRRLLATPYNGDALYLFDETGKLSSEIKLPENMFARHALQSDNDTFIVCHVNKIVADTALENRNISEVDTNGNIVRSFNCRKVSIHVQNFDWPRYLVLYDHALLIVADMLGRRIVLLESDLQMRRVLMVSLEGQPLRICLCKTSGLLFAVYYKSNKIRVYRLQKKPGDRLPVV